MKTIEAVKNKSLVAVATAGAFLATTPVLAADDPMNAAFSDRKTAGSVKIGESGQILTTAGKVFDMIKYILIVIGFALFGGGVLQVTKAAKTQGQQSQTPGWIMIGMGSLLSVAGVIFFALGSGIQGAIVDEK